MTYDEMLRLYQESGGGLQQPDYTSFTGSPQSRAVMLPDGRTAFALDDGSVVVAQRTPDGQFNNIETFAPGAQAPVESTEAFEPGANMRRSLAGAIGVGVGGPLLGGLASSLAAPAAAPAAAGGASLSELIAAQGLPAATGGMSLETAAGLLGAPAAAGAVTAGGAGLASGLANAAGSIPDFLRNNASWLLPAAGALAGVAGNGDMTTGSNSTQNMTGTSSSTGNTTGGAAGTTSTASQQSLAPWLQGYAQDYVGRAQQLAGAPSSNATMDAGRGLLAGYAQGGDPLVNAATRQQMNVIGGGMLGGNPYIDNVARGIGERMGDAYATGTRANVASRFNNDGNSVGAKSAYGQTQFMGDRAFGDSLGQTMSNLYYGNYANERAAQDAASRGSLGFGQFNVANANNLYNVGAQDWQRPFFQNQQYGAAINPAFGSQQTGTGTTAQNSWQNVLQNASTNTNTTGTQNATMSAPNNWMAGAGGALAGAGLYRTLFPRG